MILKWAYQSHSKCHQKGTQKESAAPILNKLRADLLQKRDS